MVSGSLGFSFSDSSGVTPGHCGHGTSSPPESEQEQPVLSLKLQADPLFPLLSASPCERQVEPRPCQGPSREEARGTGPKRGGMSLSACSFPCPP